MNLSQLKEQLINSIFEDQSTPGLFHLDFSEGWNDSVVKMAVDYFPTAVFSFRFLNEKTLAEINDIISITSEYEIAFSVLGENYPFKEQQAKVSCMINDGNLAVKIATDVSTKKMSTGFPVFENSIADELVMDLLHFELNSASINSDEKSLLSINSTFNLEKTLSGLSVLLGIPQRVDLNGYAWLQDGGSLFFGTRLFKDFNKDEIKIKIGPFAVSLDSIGITDETLYSFIDDAYFIRPFVIIDGTFAINEIPIPLGIEIYDFNSDILFKANFNSLLSFGLEKLEKLVGSNIGDFSAAIPDEIKNLITSITLEEFGFYANLSTTSVSRTYGGVSFEAKFDLSSYLSRPTNTIYLALQRFHFELWSQNNTPEITINGEIKIGSGYLKVQLKKNVSGFEITGWLKKDTEIKLSEIINIFSGQQLAIPELSVHELDFDFSKNNTETYWQFLIELKGQLPIPFTNPVFTLNQVDFSINSYGTCKIVGVLSVGSVDISLSADNENDGWIFEGSTGVDQEIPFGELVEMLWNDLLPDSSQNKIPDSISHLVAKNVDVTIDTTTGLSFKASVGISESRIISDDYEVSDRNDKSPELISSGEHGFKFEDLILYIERSDSIKFSAEAKFAIELEKKAGESVARELQFDVKAEYNDGWDFSAKMDGSITLADLIGHFAKRADMPFALNDFSFSDLNLSFNTKSGDKHFNGSGEFKLGASGPTADLILKIDLTHPKEGETQTDFSGHLEVFPDKTLKPEDKFVFDVIFKKGEGNKIFLAAYHQENDAGKIDIRNLLQGLGVDVPSINLSLKDAFFVNDKSTSEYNLLVADIGAGMNLSNLPLVGKVLPADATVTVALRVLYASAKYGASVEAVNTILPDGISKISKPQDDNTFGFDLVAEIKIGDQKYYLELPIKLSDPPDKDNPVVNKNNPPTNQPAVAAGNQTNSTVPVNDGITWFKIGKTFGPVIFNRIGLTYKDSKLSVYPDAALSMGGLNFTLNGLSVSSPITEFKPSFDLKGLGLDFKKGPLEIGASFLRRQITINGETVDEFDGMAIISTSKLSLSALGSYCYFNGHPSLFIYAYLNQALGGPAFFFVEGLAAAFGYNRSLIMPSIDQVSTFPLVRQVMEGNDPSAATTDRALLLTQQLDALNKYVPPSAGEMFFAIGIKFNSFKLIDSFVLLAISFGNHFEIDVLGQSNIVVPSESPPGLSPLAEIKIQLMAKFIPDEGFLGVMAQLTSDSYILSRDCHLSGGAAFYSWFKGEHEGDFVVTMGGYHPAFNVPAHYPRVPRLALNWQVCRELSIKGDMYFALCTHAFMAGGHLEALFTDGPLQAWFKAGADFLIMWQPYHYDASMYLDIGASYTYHFFGTHHITIDVGADVHIWGPEFAGKATVHIWIIDVTVAFGPQGNSSPTPIGWEEFKKKCLPAKEKTISAAIIGGKHSEDDNKTAIVNPKELNIAVDSAVPVTKFIIASSDQGQPNGSNPFGIAPMNIPGNISSTQTISIKKLEAGTYVELQKEEKANFIFTSVPKKVPSAIWGTEFSPGLNTKERTIELVTGLNITTKEPAEFPIGGNPFKSLDDLLDFRSPLAFSDSIPQLDYTEESKDENIKNFRVENEYFDALCNDLEFEGISILTKK